MKKGLKLFGFFILSFVFLSTLEAKAISYGIDTTDCQIVGTNETCKVKIKVDSGTLKINKFKFSATFYNIKYSSFVNSPNWTITKNTGSTSSRQIEMIASNPIEIKEGTEYVIGSFTATDARIGCAIYPSPETELLKCYKEIVNNNTFYYDSTGKQVSQYKYRLECEKFICEEVYNDNNEKEYFDKNGNKVTKLQYDEDCLGKKYCKIENGEYFGKDGNKTTKLQYERDCLKHYCETITDGTTTIYYNSEGNEVSVESYYNDPKCMNPCSKVNGRFFDKDGKLTDELTYIKQCTKNKCTVLSDGTYYGKDGNVTTKEDYYKQCFSCVNTDDKYYDENGKEITAEEYDIKCNKHKCEIVGNTFFNKNGNIVDETTYNIECKTHKCEIVGNTFFDKNGKIVSENEYNKLCKTPENAGTGNILPIIYFVTAILFAGTVLYLSKKNNKFI